MKDINSEKTREGDTRLSQTITEKDAEKLKKSENEN
jgi:hypothetical protein